MYKGIHCIVHNSTYDFIEATIPGPKETPYENIEFKLSLEFGNQYPFRPPVIKFITPVYHPNIDTGKSDRICRCKSCLTTIVYFISYLVIALFLPQMERYA